MKAIALFFAAILFTVSFSTVYAQVSQKTNKPFSFTSFGVTITGTYSEGRLYRSTVGGTNILWGLISWGSSEVIDCRPGATVCRIEQILSVQLGRTVTNNIGQKGFEDIQGVTGASPVVIGVNEGNITFAVDLTQVSVEKRSLYKGSEWRQENAFVLAPNVVKALKLYNGKEDMGFLIPAGNYPLQKDGNIAYWTFKKPE
jgi:hypothetical protein